MTTIPRSTCLYRIYDGAGQLLYIGISHTALYRLETHFADKPWAGEVRRVEVEWHETREAASAAEVAAIKAEHPRYNILHNKRRCPHWWLYIVPRRRARITEAVQPSYGPVTADTSVELSTGQATECADCGKRP